MSEFVINDRHLAGLRRVREHLLLHSGRGGLLAAEVIEEVTRAAFAAPVVIDGAGCRWLPESQAPAEALEAEGPRCPDCKKKLPKVFCWRAVNDDECDSEETIASLKRQLEDCKNELADYVAHARGL